MLMYDVMFSRKAKGNLSSTRIYAHDAAHAALLVWSRAGNKQPTIRLEDVTGAPIPQHFQFRLDGVAVYVTRLDESEFPAIALAGKRQY